MVNFIFAIISILIIFVISIYFIYISVRLKKVEQISENIKMAKELNNLYYFDSFYQKKRVINYNAKNYRIFKKTNDIDVLTYYIQENLDYIRNDIELAINNEERYKKYEYKFNNINFETNIESLNNIKISKEKFKKIETKIMKKIMIKNTFNISTTIYINYTSPKGRNSYQKHFLCNYNQMNRCYFDWKKKQRYKSRVKCERAKMTDSLRYDVLKRDGFKCCICGLSASDGVKLHVDHIMPVSKGGKTEMNNLQTLCERCNMGKSNKI